ncbi:hypothetical protein [Piscinibacter koreensis]|uniref:Uncharacterized protein n=1 Tax=Piscinibacter koreensis TaxID=2742824 RepID=A0A7Y6NQW1_9BURK|nr:hypothetical protein [Schlegelella koreensis]NUZ07646.1 hypothetical protein [Schlegelella koreensis]
MNAHDAELGRDCSLARLMVTSVRRKPTGGYLRFLEAAHARLVTGESPENWADTRDAIAEHLAEYLRGDAERVEPDVARAMLVAFEQMQAKEASSLFTPLPRRRGESPNPAAVKACLEEAGTYLRFCLSRRGAAYIDPTPIVTVQRAFAVSRRNVFRWKEHGRDWADDRLPHGMGPEEFFAHLRARMLGASVQYVRFGGASSGAVQARDRKRRVAG